MIALIVKLALIVAIGLGLPTRHLGTIDGHHDCTAILGDTSVVLCTDGYVTTS